MERKWLTELRERKQLTKKALSKITGIGESSIGKYENGKRRPIPEKAQTLGNVLGFDWQLFY